MNPEPLLSAEVVRLGKAVRFALVCFLMVLSYYTIRTASAIPGFEQIFRDMFNGKDLPALTRFIIKIHYVLVACSWLIPLFAVASLFSRRIVESFYLLGGLFLAIVVLFVLMCQGLSAPLFQIIQSMQGG